MKATNGGKGMTDAQVEKYAWTKDLSSGFLTSPQIR